MSKADKIFKGTCMEILCNGTDTRGQEVRPHWPDGASAYTIKQFGVVNEYDLREEFPAITLRRIALKSCMDEILWIYQRKSNNIKDLKPHIWDEWADEDGSIGVCYGAVVGIKNPYRDMMIDQMDRVIYQLKNEPFSRRIMLNIYQFDYLHLGHLDPCCFCFQLNVTEEVDKITGDKVRVLNGVLSQRSQDMLAANGWNVCQYSILLMMLAQVSNMVAGRLIHVITDAHIYDRHVPMIKELLNRKEYEAPKVSLNLEIKDFYDFTTDDLIVEDYAYGPQIENIPIAV